MPRKPRAPTTARPRSVRFTDQEWAEVIARAEAVGLTPGAWLRARALEVS